MANKKKHKKKTETIRSAQKFHFLFTKIIKQSINIKTIKIVIKIYLTMLINSSFCYFFSGTSIDVLSSGEDGNLNGKTLFNSFSFDFESVTVIS